MNKKTRDYYSWLVTQGHYPKPPLPKGRGLRLRDKWVKRWLQKMGDYQLAQYYLKYKYGPAALIFLPGLFYMMTAPHPQTNNHASDEHLLPDHTPPLLSVSRFGYGGKNI